MKRPNASTSASSTLIRARKDSLCHMGLVRDRQHPLAGERETLTAQMSQLSNCNVQQHRFRCMPGGTGVATIASCVRFVALQQRTERGRLGPMLMHVLIVDDHPIVASGCRALFAGQSEIVLMEAPDAESGERVF